MSGVALVLLLLAVSVGLRILAERLVIPYAALLVVGGLALAFVPHLPRIEVPPDVLFLVFVPPLLYSGAAAFPLRDFKRVLGPIARLSIGMVVVTIFAVAVIAHAIDPTFTWAAAFALGAIVSPPDPVSVVSVIRELRMPRDIERILEGEGLLNDATALVAYRIAVAAAVTGIFSLWRAGVQFFAVSLGGVVVGLVIGVIVVWALRMTRTVGVAQNTVSLLTPFATYLAAELVGVSGVVAVVTTAVHVARTSRDIGGPRTRLQNAAMWEVVSFVLESLVFILIGVQLPYVTRELHGAAQATVMRDAVIISLGVIGVRMLWVFPSAYVGGSIGRWLRHGHDRLRSWREVLFVGWAGVRGGDSLVIALALPFVTAQGTPFPARDRILFITFSVIFVTLVLQGPTLRPVARWLRLRDDGTTEDEEAHARLTAAEAGLEALDALAARSRYPEVIRYLQQRHRQRARRWAAREAHAPEAHRGVAAHTHFVPAPSHDAGALDESRAAEYRRVRSAMIEAEQRALIVLRDRDEIADDVMRTVQRELDLEQELLDSRDPVVEPTREVQVDRATSASSTAEGGDGR
jgi:CPA1 family monovalent cation:H+ antiporter